MRRPPLQTTSRDCWEPTKTSTQPRRRTSRKVHLCNAEAGSCRETQHPDTQRNAGSWIRGMISQTMARSGELPTLITPEDNDAQKFVDTGSYREALLGADGDSPLAGIRQESLYLTRHDVDKYLCPAGDKKLRSI